MGAKFESYTVMRMETETDINEFELEDMNKKNEIIVTGYRAKMIPLINPTQTKDRYGGMQFMDKRKVFGVKSFTGILQGDYLYLESSFNTATQRYDKIYRIVNDPRIGINYCVFQVERV